MQVSTVASSIYQVIMKSTVIGDCYREDIVSAEVFKSDEDKENYYRELKTAAESGWDFSSRWFILNGTNKGKCVVHSRY